VRLIFLVVFRIPLLLHGESPLVALVISSPAFAAPHSCNPAFSLRSATLIPIETHNQLI
jgi:hypothetical protein